MTISELVFIPFPHSGNLLPMVELAKLLLDREPRFSVTIIIMNPDSLLDQETCKTIIPRLRFIDIPCDDSAKDPNTFFSAFIEDHKYHVKKIVQDIIDSGSVSLAGFIVDMLCISMIDVANEFGVPTYTYISLSAATLGLMFYVQDKRDYENKDVIETNDVSGSQLWMPSYYNPIPVQVLRHAVLDKEVCSKMFLDLTKKFRKSKGIIINTFLQLEWRGMRALNGSYALIPKVFPVGPILNPKNNNAAKTDASIVTWLDDQPESSVVFLSFGSFDEEEQQVKEIAIALLELSGQRFLWSSEGYKNLEEMGLPKGFLERTSSVGKVIGLVHQMAVLSHPSTGGFVSHFGWNSILESICSGVPIAAWPINAEQQLNAFQIVGERGLAAEIKVDDYKIARADEIVRGINKLMNDDEIKKKVKQMKQESRLTMAEGGQSYFNVKRLIDHLMINK